MKTVPTDDEVAPRSPRPRLARRLISLITAHPILSGTLAAVGVGLAIFVLVFFQPQKLFLDDRVNEELPSYAAPTPSLPTFGRTRPPEIARGSFRGLAHAGSGDATVLDFGGGRRILDLANFSVENGPDLFVYLSSVPAGSGEDAFPGMFVNLGKLKGNIGNQNYELPANVDLSTYRSIVIYCKRFTTPFAVAPLTS